MDRRTFFKRSGAATIAASGAVASSTTAGVASELWPACTSQSNSHILYHYDHERPYRYDGVMQGNPPLQDAQVTRDNCLENARFGRWALHHMRELIPTQRVGRSGSATLVLPARPMDDRINQMNIPNEQGGRITVSDFLKQVDATAFIVLKDGKILTEQYFAGARPDTLQILYSASKSLASTMIGALLGQGKLKEDEKIETYIPELSGYRGATLRQLLDMTSGVEYMDAAQPASDPQRLGPMPDLCVRWGAFWRKHACAAGFFSSPPSDIGAGQQTEYDFLRSLRQVRGHGANFFYKCADVRTLVWAAEQVTSQRFADIFGELVWSKIGAEQDAYVLCDGRNGSAFVSVGLAVTLRDFARVGLMLMNRGRLGDRQIVPGSYVSDILNCKWNPTLMYDPKSYSPHHTEVPPELRHSCDGLGYRSWFWTWPGGQFCAIGACGQQFNVHPEGRVVVAKFSAIFPENVKTWHQKFALERIGMKAITEQVTSLA